MSVPERVSAHVQPDGTEPAPSDQTGPPEERERVAAWRRGEAPAPTAEGGTTDARAAAAGRAFAAFAENVRDYAIFLTDPSGTIMFWGEGARLI